MTAQQTVGREQHDQDEDDAEDQALGLEPQVDEFVDEETLEVKVREVK